MNRVLAWTLSPLALAYTAGVACRNRRFERRPERVHCAPVPVISVGNVTTGGTGKTPLVIALVQRLQALGRRPAVLTRGYRAPPGRDSDEVIELRESLPGAAIVVNPDRVAGAREAVRVQAADCLVLDDGFQHRRLARDLDLVAIDALDPWGGGWTLPSGRLREPLSALRRAHLLVITRANQVDGSVLSGIQRRLDLLAPQARTIRASVEPVAMVYADGRTADVAELAYHLVLPVCAIGNPGTFLRTVALHAGCVSRPLAFRDHHRYRPRDVRRILARARRERADLVVVTRKDWSKLAFLWPAGEPSAPRLARLDVRLALDDPDGILDAALADCLARHGRR